jgi:hypothetical protein
MKCAVKPDIISQYGKHSKRSRKVKKAASLHLAETCEMQKRLSRKEYSCGCLVIKAQFAPLLPYTFGRKNIRRYARLLQKDLPSEARDFKTDAGTVEEGCFVLIISAQLDKKTLAKVISDR